MNQKAEKNGDVDYSLSAEDSLTFNHRTESDKTFAT